MAATTGAKPSKAAAAKPPEDRKPTRRMVLRAEKVIVLSPEVDDATIKAAQDLIRKADKTSGVGIVAETWRAVGEFEGASKEDAIEAHAGKPGTAEALPGDYKAPTVAAFAGGSRYKAPPKPLVEREALD